MARPREFDEADVIGKLLQAFWQYGYRGTSFDTLEQATGLKRSSLYNAFGGKTDLFCAALDAYTSGPCRELHRPLVEERGAVALSGYLSGIERYSRSSMGGNGCFMLNTAAEPIEDEQVAVRVRAHVSGLTRLLRRAYEEGLEDGNVSPNLTGRDAADWLVSVVRGVLAGAVSNEKPAVLSRTLNVTRQTLGVVG